MSLINTKLGLLFWARLPPPRHKNIINLQEKVLHSMETSNTLLKTALALLDLCVQGKCDSQRINIGEIYSNSGPKKFDTLKYLFWSLPNNGQILSSMLSIKFWWQSCDNECCLVEWQHYDSPTSEYSNISQLQSRTVSELGLEQDTLRWLSPGSRLLDTPVPASGPLWLSQVSFCQITRGIIYCQTINTQAVNYGDVQRVEIPCY